MRTIILLVSIGMLSACTFVKMGPGGDAIKVASGKNIVINVNAAIAALLLEAELPPAIARGFNLIARCAGLVGHLLEELEEPAGYHIWKMAEEGIPYQEA